MRTDHNNNVNSDRARKHFLSLAEKQGPPMGGIEREREREREKENVASTTKDLAVVKVGAAGAVATRRLFDPFEPGVEIWPYQDRHVKAKQHERRLQVADTPNCSATWAAILYIQPVNPCHGCEPECRAHAWNGNLKR